MGKHATVVALLVGLINSAFARDDGRYANEPLKNWFDNLTSSNGKCCSFADGFSVSDVEWDTDDGHYRVLLHGEWINVPNSSVITQRRHHLPAAGRAAERDSNLRRAPRQHRLHPCPIDILATKNHCCRPAAKALALLYQCRQRRGTCTPLHSCGWRCT